MKMKLTMEVLHTGTDDKLPEIKCSYEVPNKTDEVIYHRQAEGLWAIKTGWPMGKEFGMVAETLYKQAIRQEFASDDN